MSLNNYSLDHLSFECISSPHIKDINDDFSREAAFERQALETAIRARKVILEAGIPFTRPAGYFCEMIKTEDHMRKISSRIEEQKEADKAAELSRKQRQNKKFGKKVQKEREHEKMLKVNEEKKKMAMVRKRTKKDSTGALEDDEFGIHIDDNDGEEDRGSRKKFAAGKGRKPAAVSQKRQVRNQRFGFGGQKRGNKRNDRESVNDDSFNVKKNKMPFKGMLSKGFQKGGPKGASSGPKGAGSARKGAKNRPGKARRVQMRSRSKK